MNKNNASVSRKIFGVVIEPQSYLNIGYLLLAFPLGIIYFTFLVTGLSVGLGMAVTLAGIPILLLVLGGSDLLVRFERWSAREVLKQQIPQTSTQSINEGWWNRFKAHLGRRVTWTGMLYLLLKFPFGVAAFVIVVSLISTTIGLLFAPAYMWTSDSVTWGNWEFDPFTWSWIAMLIGIPMVFFSMHVMNGLAKLSGKLAGGMLG